MAARAARRRTASPRASRRSSSWRRSARWSRRSSRSSSTAAPTRRWSIGKKDEQERVLLPAWGALDANQIAVIIARRILAYADDSEVAARLKQLEHAQAIARRDRGCRRAHAAFLLRLPAQHLDQRAGGKPRLCRHRLPLHGAVDGPAHRGLHPDGRRRARTGSARRRSPSAAMSSRISATAPGAIPARSPCARRRRPASTSPTRSSTTTRWRMTGGQPVEGGLTVDQVARQAAAEGAKHDRASSPTTRTNIRPSTEWPAGRTIHHRSELDDGAGDAARGRRASAS